MSSGLLSLRSFQLLFLLWLVLMAGASSARVMLEPGSAASLAESLNPDGTLKMVASGSFDARSFQMSIAPDGKPVFRPQGARAAGDEHWQDGFGLPHGTDNEVDVVLRSGTNIYIAGTFTVVGTVAASFIAKWDGVAWSSLGTGLHNGVNGQVSALAVAGNGDVYAGGYFTEAGGVAANYIAKWNGTAWTSLGAGNANGVAGGFVNALAATPNGDVYVGGNFTQAGGVAARGIARWDGAAWSTLGAGSTNGVAGLVSTLAAASNGDVYVGGYFTQAGSLAVNSVAKWSGAAWSSLGVGTANGVDGVVRALAVTANGEVYAGGLFATAGGVSASNIARWDGTSWSPLGTGLANGVSNRVSALATAANGAVYVGGSFRQAGGAPADYVATWNGTNWSSMGAGLSGSYSPEVQALAVAATGEVYVGGLFARAGTATSANLATWDSTTWAAVAVGTANGVTGYVSALVVATNGDVYVGGGFTQVGGVLANNIARWNGSTWSSLGTSAANGTDSDSQVMALALGANGDLYIGGRFDHAGGVFASNVARWNGTTWSALGTGAVGVNGGGSGYASSVRALAFRNGSLYVGGYFLQAGTVAVSHVAQWNGTAWNALGAGVDGSVTALALAANGDVYVGGFFVQAGGLSANHVARWNGTAWSSLGTGANNGVVGNSVFSVYCLAVSANGDLYAGGYFYQAGGVSADNVARWNGTTWSSLGSGTDNQVSALAIAATGEVYAGGYFRRAGGIANGVGKWDGTTWSALGSGLGAGRIGVVALATGPGARLYAGGFFTTVGDASKPTAHFAAYDPAGFLAAAPPAALAPVVMYPNPAHHTATLHLPATSLHQPLTLTDAQGRIVRRYPAPTGAAATLDLRGLPAGIYVVRHGQFTQRLVVE